MGLIDWMFGGRLDKEDYYDKVHPPMTKEEHDERIRHCMFYEKMTGDDWNRNLYRLPLEELRSKTTELQQAQALLTLQQNAHQYVKNNFNKLKEPFIYAEIPEAQSNMRQKMIDLASKTPHLRVKIDESNSPPKLQKCETYMSIDRYGEYKFNIEIVVGQKWDQCVFDLTI